MKGQPGQRGDRCEYLREQAKGWSKAMLRKWMFWAWESPIQGVDTEGWWNGNEWASVNRVNRWRLWQKYFWFSKHWFLHLLAQGFSFSSFLSRPLRGKPALQSSSHSTYPPHTHVHISSLPYNAVGVCLCLVMCECNTLCKIYSHYRKAAS